MPINNLAQQLTTAKGGILLGTAISPTLLLIGSHADTLSVGMGAAILISFWISEIDNWKKSASVILLSAAFSVFGAPFIVGLNPSWTPVADTAELLLSLSIGVFVPCLIPIWPRLVAQTANKKASSL